MTAPSETTEAGWTADASTFGARLALVRQKMGWGNVEKAARECGIPVETWRSWERDNREPHRMTTIAMAIATRTGCDYLWLCHGPDRGARTAPSGRYGRTRVLARNAPDVPTTLAQPVGQTRAPLAHLRPVRQLPTTGLNPRRPVGAGVL